MGYNMKHGKTNFPFKKTEESPLKIISYDRGHVDQTVATEPPPPPPPNQNQYRGINVNFIKRNNKRPRANREYIPDKFAQSQFKKTQEAMKTFGQPGGVGEERIFRGKRQFRDPQGGWAGMVTTTRGGVTTSRMPDFMYEGYTGSVGNFSNKNFGGMSYEQYQNQNS